MRAPVAWMLFMLLIVMPVWDWFLRRCRTKQQAKKTIPFLVGVALVAVPVFDFLFS